MRKVISQNEACVIKVDAIKATNICCHNCSQGEIYGLHAILNEYELLIGTFKTKQRAIQVQKDLWLNLELGEKFLSDIRIPEDEEDSK